MSRKCPRCTTDQAVSGEYPKVVRYGRYYRKSDGRWISRFMCRGCGHGFSNATFDARFGQNKRHKNYWVMKLICSGLSMRRAARVLNITRKTVSRKLLFLGALAEVELEKMNRERPPSTEIEFDDLLTCEQTKCKMLSVTTFVETGSRWIVDLDVARMPATGKLAKKSVEKYGFRKDERPKVRRELFKRVRPFIAEGALIKSDESPHYPKDVKEAFPDCAHKRIKGKRGCVTGQGELKRVGFDELFSLNHTYATQRDDVARLRRQTWSISKKAENLRAHLFLHAVFHNRWLLKQQAKKTKKAVA